MDNNTFYLAAATIYAVNIAKLGKAPYNPRHEMDIALADAEELWRATNEHIRKMAQPALTK